MEKSSTAHEQPSTMDVKKVYQERGMTGVVDILQVLLPLLEEYLPQIIALLQQQSQPTTKRGKDNG